MRAFVSRAAEYGASGVHDTADTHWIQGLPDADGFWDHEKIHPPITNPMSRYPKYSGSRSSRGVAKVPSVIVEIEDENGLVGMVQFLLCTGVNEFTRFGFQELINAGVNL